MLLYLAFHTLLAILNEHPQLQKKSLLFRNGPKKSTLILCHGLEGQVHGCNGVLDGDCLTCRQDRQLFTISLISLSICGQPPYTTMGYCFHPDNSRVCVMQFTQYTCFFNTAGTTTLGPRRRHPSSTNNCCDLFQYGTELLLLA